MNIRGTIGFDTLPNFDVNYIQGTVRGLELSGLLTVFGMAVPEACYSKGVCPCQTKSILLVRFFGFRCFEGTIRH